MALTQFNEWEPKLDGLEGNFQAEPRVFAHDAASIVIGAINNSHSNHGLKVTNSGTGYIVNDTITLSSPAAGGAPNRAVVTVLAVNASGAVTDYSVTTAGSVYIKNESLTQAATSGVGANFAANVSNIDIPKTQKRGCCIYVGNISGGADLEVMLESGNTVIFKGLTAGSFLPILARQVITTSTTATDLIAIY
jgi:hypothetical protein